MRRGIIAVLLMLAALSARLPVDAQSDVPPYLYYYSRLLGGIIIERADGTDSRIIGQDVIPPNMVGLDGPGWSPSGKYFAGYRIVYNDVNRGHGEPYVIDRSGNSISVGVVGTTDTMEWAPSGGDILLIVGRRDTDHFSGANTFYWLFDLSHGPQAQWMAEFGASWLEQGTDRSNVTWDVPHQQITFDIKPQLGPGPFRVTERFDGSTSRERIPDSEFVSIDEAFYRAHPDVAQPPNEETATSPSGKYQIKQGSLGDYPVPILTKLSTGETVQLPQNTEGYICGNYLWNSDERYILTFNGTALTDFCGSATIGVTDSSGKLWREVGGCDQKLFACAGWLPPQVDVSALPPGQPKPVQLDPVKYDQEHAKALFIESPEIATERWFCTGKTDGEIRDANKHTLYKMGNEECPFDRTDLDPTLGLPVVAAYDTADQLLATYGAADGTGVILWVPVNGIYKKVLRLNSQGLGLEFSADCQFLIAGNNNGRKFYAVKDILAYAKQGMPTN